MLAWEQPEPRAKWRMIIIHFNCKSQGYLAKHKFSTDWDDYKSTEIRRNQIKSNVGFLGEGKTP